MTEEEYRRTTDARLRLYHSLLADLYVLQFRHDPKAFEALMDAKLLGLYRVPPAAIDPDGDIEMRLNIKSGLDQFALAVRQGFADLGP